MEWDEREIPGVETGLSRHPVVLPIVHILLDDREVSLEVH